MGPDAMMWLALFSIYIPDAWKSDGWILWDRKMTWRCCRRVYSDFRRAYECLLVHERTISLINEFRGKANERR